MNIAYPFAPVRADTAGGAEQVLAMIDSALVSSGHRSLVIAAEASCISGTLLPVPNRTGRIDDRLREAAYRDMHGAIARALDGYPVDVMHFHGIDFRCYLPPDGPPALITMHLPLAWYAPGDFTGSRGCTFYNCVSATQQRSAPPGMQLLPYIENGVPVEALQMQRERKPFALSLGRICPEKGFHLALDAAAAAGIPYLIAGEVFRHDAHELYYREEILPRLDHASRRFIGAVGFEAKRRLLNSAKCLLAPSLVDETSSLAAMEALACGTPVIAYPSGALRDIVDHGVTGFLVNSVDEMVRGIRKAGRIDSEACRKSARERFSSGRMTAAYLETYDKLARCSLKNGAHAGERNQYN